MTIKESNINSAIDEHFPLESYRPHQKETICKIIKAFLAGKKNVIVESPTGSGKSVIAMTVAKLMGSAYYLTIQKTLQTTLENDFSDWAASLKGRNAYPCWMIREKLKMDSYATADKGMCVRMNKSKLGLCSGQCEYFEAIEKAEQYSISIFNFSSFLYQRTMTDRFQDQRELIITDEAHNNESLT